MKDDAGSPRLVKGWKSETVTVIDGRADAGLVIVCDHAGNAFPSEYGTLGLPTEQLARHIAYDIGAAAVTTALARALGVPAVLSHYSRLLIDLNRGIDDPTLIMRLSDGAVIPGNRHLSAEERENRITRFWRPYHAAIDSTLDGCLAAGVVPAIVSVHSFTDVWKSMSRPWHAGVLWDKDQRLVDPLLAALRTEPDLVVGNNEPYTGRLLGDCMWQHGTQRGLAHAIIEIRQDLIRAPGGQVAWADRLHRLLRGVLADPGARARLHCIEHHGTYADSHHRR